MTKTRVWASASEQYSPLTTVHARCSTLARSSNNYDSFMLTTLPASLKGGRCVTQPANQATDMHVAFLVGGKGGRPPFSRDRKPNLFVGRCTLFDSKIHGGTECKAPSDDLYRVGPSAKTARCSTLASFDHADTTAARYVARRLTPPTAHHMKRICATILSTTPTKKRYDYRLTLNPTRPTLPWIPGGGGGEGAS